MKSPIEKEYSVPITHQTFISLRDKAFSLTLSIQKIADKIVKLRQKNIITQVNYKLQKPKKPFRIL